MRLGVDLGGTKIEAVVLAANGDVCFRRRVATPGNDYQAIITTLCQLVDEAERDIGSAARSGPGAADVASIGIGTPGTASPVDGRMRNCNTTCLNGRHLQRDLESALGRPVRIANDANCFALSEATDGAGAGQAVVFGVILGTGVGGGVVIHQRLLNGANGIGSEWGHNLMPGIGEVFESSRRACYCGRHDCVETYLSGAGLVTTYQQLGGKPLAAGDIAALAARGDKTAAGCMAIYHQQLACALSQVINILDPDVVVLGGGLSNIQTLYEHIPRLWGRWIFSDNIQTRLLPAQFGDSSGVRGAAWLW